MSNIFYSSGKHADFLAVYISFKIRPLAVEVKMVHKKGQTSKIPLINKFLNLKKKIKNGTFTMNETLFGTFH